MSVQTRPNIALTMLPVYLVAALQASIGELLFISLYQACAESLAGENVRRLFTLKCADLNITEMLEYCA